MQQMTIVTAIMHEILKVRDVQSKAQSHQKIAFSYYVTPSNGFNECLITSARNFLSVETNIEI